MSSYIAPNRYADKTHFNSSEFKSSLTVDDVDSKLDTKLGSTVSSYIDSGTFDNRNGAGSTTYILVEHILRPPLWFAHR